MNSSLLVGYSLVINGSLLCLLWSLLVVNCAAYFVTRLGTYVLYGAVLDATATSTLLVQRYCLSRRALLSSHLNGSCLRRERETDTHFASGLRCPLPTPVHPSIHPSTPSQFSVNKSGPLPLSGSGVLGLFPADGVQLFMSRLYLV